MRFDRVINFVDAHAEGEPSRIVTGGVVDVPGETMLQKRQYLLNHRDDLRCFLLREPHGMVSLSADVLLPSTHPEADLGYVIMESTDYPLMSGTNTMNVVTVALETGILPMVEPVTTVTLESPAGLIKVTANCRDGKCESVTFVNQPSFAVELDAVISVPGIGELTVDVAYGGAFFVFVDATALGMQIVPNEARRLSELGQLIKQAAAEQISVAHPDDLGVDQITFTTFVAPPRAGGDGRNVNIVSPGRVDRSACGTSTCARLALLHARSELGVGEEYVHESILSGTFQASIEEVVRVGSYTAVVPRVTGRSWIYGSGQLGIHPTDPFPSGYQLNDAWGTEDVEVVAASGCQEGRRR